MLFRRHDTAIVHMNSQQLCYLHKACTRSSQVKIQAQSREGHPSPLFSVELLVSWILREGESLVSESMAIVRLPMILGMTPHMYTYGQLKSDSVGLKLKNF